MSLRIHTLGPFRVLRDDTLIPDAAWKTQKNRLLLKILLTYRGHNLTHDQLIEWLWHDLDPAAAGRNLRVAISQLRRILEPDLPPRAPSGFVFTTAAGYTWNTDADYWLDAEEFETRCAGFQLEPQRSDLERQIASAQQARALYHGDYLEEDRYADWATVERERLRELYFVLVTRLAEAYAQFGRYRQAVTLCREILAVDRCRESVWCQLMLYHYHAGDQSRALRAYEECRQALTEELGVEALPETSTLAQQIRRREVAGPWSDPQRPYPPPAAIERLRHLPISLARMPFVGREAEYARIVSYLAQAAEGRGCVVLIEGEVGVGKTRLAEEVLAYARQPGATILEGHCREEGGRPYQPIVEALRTVLSGGAGEWGSGGAGVQGSEGAKMRKASLLPCTPSPLHPGSLAPPLPRSTLATVAELLPELRQTYPDLPTLPPLPAEQEKARLFEALTQLLSGINPTDSLDWRIGPSVNPAHLVFFLDDLHWADASTLEFLSYFAAQIPRRPALVLGTFRSEEVPADAESGLGRLLWTLRRQGVLHRITLERLSPEAVIQLIRTMSGLSEQAAFLGNRFYQETEGNPLFLLSMLQSGFEEGLFTVDEAGVWAVAETRFLSKTWFLEPATMHWVISRRLERLNDEQRQVLEAAAVLGRQFQWPALSHMRTWRRDVLLDHLDGLVGALFIREREHEDYDFSHDKVRQVIYAGIAEARRGWLHGKAGAALEMLHAGQLDEVAGTLAYHFQQAGRLDKAFGYRLQAGWHATRLYANTEAVNHYRTALDLAGQADFQPAADDLREAHERLGGLYEAAGQYAHARDEFEAARHHATTPAERVRLLYKLANSHDREGLAGPSRELLRQAVDEVDRLGVDQVGPLEAARVCARWAIMGSGRHGEAEAERYARLAIAILDQNLAEVLSAATPLLWGEYDAVHSVLINAGETFRHWGLWDEAARLFQQSLAVAERYADPNGIGYSCNNLGDVRLAQGDFAGARALYKRAAEAWVHSGHLWPEMAARTHWGIAWACEGRWNEAATCLEQARAAGERIDPTEWLARVHLWLSLAELRCTGDQQKAQVHRERAVAVAEAAGQALPEDLWHLVLSVAEACAGRLAAAWEHFVPVQALWEAALGDAAIYGRWILARCEPPAWPED